MLPQIAVSWTAAMVWLAITAAVGFLVSLGCRGEPSRRLVGGGLDDHFNRPSEATGDRPEPGARSDRFAGQ